MSKIPIYRLRAQNWAFRRIFFKLFLAIVFQELFERIFLTRKTQNTFHYLLPTEGVEIKTSISLHDAVKRRHPYLPGISPAFYLVNSYFPNHRQTDGL